jgi:putative tricarboxylic transport membrane protein
VSLVGGHDLRRFPDGPAGRGWAGAQAAFTSSFVGALFSVILITLFEAIRAEVALKFGPPEFFAFQLPTFSSFIGLGGRSPIKSIVSILVGFILALVGLDWRTFVRGCFIGFWMGFKPGGATPASS